MTTFYLIRHGAKMSEDAMVGRMPGIHLTAEGRRQAAAIGEHLRRARITQLFSSPLERAVETAEPLARLKRLEVQSSLAFHEIDMGSWTGRPKRALTALASWKRFCRFPAGTEIPGGETLPEAQSRIVSEIVRLRHAHANTGIAIVTHEDPIRLAICHFIGAPTNVYDKISIRLGSVTVLQIDTHRVLLDRVNEVPPPRR
jgi:probable phosphoglycerate mutase